MSMIRRLQAVFMATVMIACSFPSYAFAANVFGGRVSVSLPCFNAAIWTTVGAPRGGIYIWTPATKTYPYGPPASGKYVLGLYGIPYFCIVTIAPLFVLPGISMTMLGSSGPSAPAAPPQSQSTPTPATSTKSAADKELEDLLNGKASPAEQEKFCKSVSHPEGIAACKPYVSD